ncbi:hypothetical protein MHK_009439 [Candidatus Magnetomorum sp. HK-1]|nr:hypothetical protein MHK_009439 [Candidatus Magnetomorum sp. HK-1]
MEVYKSYKTPIRKLCKVFLESRNNWKLKCRYAKKEIKDLANINRYSKSRIEFQNKRIQGLEKELAQVKKQIANYLKRDEAQKIEDNLPAFKDVPRKHTYSTGHMMLFISLVLFAGISLRGAAKAIETFILQFQLNLLIPSWYAGRLWLLRLGLYKLLAPKQIASDWIWIVDHTNQIGSEKCLLILGVRLSSLGPNLCLKHEDVEPISLIPVKSSNGKVVWQQLEDSVKKTGVPRAIVGDHGSDLKSGVEQFCNNHKKTAFIYDIKHKTASVLKQELKGNEEWESFCKYANQKRNEIQQTRLAPVMPPNQKSKARFMNVGRLISWGKKLLSFLKKGKKEKLEGIDYEKIEKKFEELKEYESQISEWDELDKITRKTESVVRKGGIYKGCSLKLETELKKEIKSERGQRVATELINFVEHEETKAKANEKLLGSSEIIESVFGKLKRIEGDQEKSGFTGNVLSVCAMVSRTTLEMIKEAMETITTPCLNEWCMENLGDSIQCQRKKIFKPCTKEGVAPN